MCCQCTQKHPLVIVIVIIEGLPNLVFGLPLVGRLVLNGKQTQVIAFQQIPQLSHESGHQNNSVAWFSDAANVKRIVTNHNILSQKKPPEEETLFFPLFTSHENPLV